MASVFATKASGQSPQLWLTRTSASALRLFQVRLAELVVGQPLETIDVIAQRSGLGVAENRSRTRHAVNVISAVRALGNYAPANNACPPFGFSCVPLKIESASWSTSLVSKNLYFVVSCYPPQHGRWHRDRISQGNRQLRRSTGSSG